MKSILVFIGVVLLSSCATMFNGSKARIMVMNDEVKKPVTLTVGNKMYPNIYLPAQVRVKRGFRPTQITATAEGYEPGSVTVKKKFNATTLWNIWLGGIPGLPLMPQREQ